MPRGALGTVGIVATGVLMLSPFERPVGEIAAGAGTFAAWQRALFGASRLAVR